MLGHHDLDLQSELKTTEIERLVINNKMAVQTNVESTSIPQASHKRPSKYRTSFKPFLATRQTIRERLGAGNRSASIFPNSGVFFFLQQQQGIGSYDST